LATNDGGKELQRLVEETPQETPLVKLITFGHGLPGIHLALERLRKQAASIDLIDSVSTYNSNDLGDPYFHLFGDLINRYPRGFGLWSWKPYLVNRELQNMQEGDILIYADVGVELNIGGLSKLSAYLDYTSRTGSLFFSTGLQNRFWTKPSNNLISNPHFFRNQVSATLFFLKVSPVSKALAADWLELSAKDNAINLKDGDQSEPLQLRKWKSHRHDQSVLSKVVFDYEIETLEDATYMKPWIRGKKEPFLALRNKQTGYSWILPALFLPRPVFRIWQFATLIITPGVLRSKLLNRSRK
jgi:hypothetical protein